MESTYAEPDVQAPTRKRSFRSYVQRNKVLLIIVSSVVLLAFLLWLIFRHDGSVKQQPVSQNPVVRSYQAKLAGLKSAAEKSPQSAAAQSAYAEALYVTGDKQAAKKEYQAALKLNPNDATTENNLGNTERDLGDYTAAETAYETSIKLNPTSQNAYANLANVQLYSLHQPANAVGTYQAAIKAIGSTAQLQILLGLAYEQDKQPDTAAAIYRGILATDPTNQAAKDNLDRLSGKE